MAKRPPSETLTRLLAEMADVRAELGVVRLGQEQLTRTLRQMAETWTGMFKQLGLQLDLLTDRVTTRQDALDARVAAIEHRVAALEARD